MGQSSIVAIQCQYSSESAPRVNTEKLMEVCSYFGPIQAPLETVQIDGVPFYVVRYEGERYAGYALENLHDYMLDGVLLKVKRIS